MIKLQKNGKEGLSLFPTNVSVDKAADKFDHGYNGNLSTKIIDICFWEEETGMEKTFAQMSNRELFCVLTGDRGIMAQMYLQNLVKEYLASHDDDPDLATMVKITLEEKESRE